MTSRRHTTSNQCCNNVVYVNAEMCTEYVNVEQRRISVAYFNVDLNNVRQRQNNVVILNVDFHNVGQHEYEYDHLQKIKIKPRVKNKIIY